MSYEPRIAVGLRALHCALAAKADRINDRHRMKLLEDVLFHCRDDDLLCNATLEFVALSRSHAVQAGQVYLDFVTTIGVELSFTASQLEMALETIEGESVENYLKPGEVSFGVAHG